MSFVLLDSSILCGTADSENWKLKSHFPKNITLALTYIILKNIKIPFLPFRPHSKKSSTNSRNLFLWEWNLKGKQGSIKPAFERGNIKNSELFQQARKPGNIL